MFLQWQNRWASRHDDIVCRLEAIDSQLNGWKSEGEETPRLAVVGTPEEAREEARGEETRMEAASDSDCIDWLPAIS